MRTNNRAPLIIPVLIIVVGVGWLLTAQGFGPGINWVWTLGLGVIGILTFVVSGYDKVSVVVGPFFLLASVLAVLRQTGDLRLDVEVPVLVIGIGVLMLVAQLPAVPKPGWFVPLPTPPTEEPGAPRNGGCEPNPALRRPRQAEVKTSQPGSTISERQPRCQRDPDPDCFQPDKSASALGWVAGQGVDGRLDQQERG